jgi:aminomuconate-semialdehyde/2-hydroxymuconate-6-semialdehyde dehydrogenase
MATPPYAASMVPVGEIRNFVGGSWIDGVDQFKKLSPVDGSEVAIVHEASPREVDAAVAASRMALDGTWGNATVAQRASLLRRIAEGIEERFDEFVAAEVSDTGKPESLARELDVVRALANFRTFADVISAADMDSFLTEFPHQTALNYAVSKPLGVVAVIVPWNLPLLLLTWKVAPALACGNAVVVKPSEESPSSAALLAEVMNEVGAPEGIYNVINGLGPDSAGELLAGHSQIDGITFTGESSTGSSIMRSASSNVRPVSFELGGKNAAIVFADADLESALAGLTRSVFTNTGQVCLCTERVYVERPLFDQVADGLVERAKELRLGRPEHEDTTTGPLISRQQRDRVLEYYAVAEDEGAEVLVGGGVPRLGGELDAGAWIEPTIWVGLDNKSTVMQEEVFGPVAGLVPFDTEDQAIRLANDTRFGLAASVWTENIGKGHRVAQAMRVGISWVNSWFLRDLRSPFGGMGLSGIGREGGAHSLRFYSQSTNVCVSL